MAQDKISTQLWATTKNSKTARGVDRGIATTAFISTLRPWVSFFESFFGVIFRDVVQFLVATACLVIEGVGYHNPPISRVMLSRYSGIASAGMSVGEASVMGRDGDTYLATPTSKDHKISDDSQGLMWNKSCFACGKSKRKCDGLYPCRLVCGQVDE